MFFAVSAIVRLVRPWYVSKTMMAWRPVARRAILTAFSIASAPELKSAESWRASRRQSRELLTHLD